MHLRKCIPTQDFQGHSSYPITPPPPPAAPFNLVEINHEGGEAEGDGFAAVNSSEDGIDYPNLGLLCRHKAAHQSHEGDQAYLGSGRRQGRQNMNLLLYYGQSKNGSQLKT